MISPLDVLLILTRSLGGTKAAGILSDTLDLLLTGVACSRGAVYTLGSGSLELVADHGLPRDRRSSFARLPLVGIPWFVAQNATQQRKLVADRHLGGSGGPVEPAAFAAAGWDYAIACPIASGRLIHGVIVLAWPGAEEPAPSVLSVVEIACHLVALQLASRTEVQRRAENQDVDVRAARLTALGLLATGFAAETSEHLAELARRLEEQQRLPRIPDDHSASSPEMAVDAGDTATVLEHLQETTARFLGMTEPGVPGRLDLRAVAEDAIALVKPLIHERRIEVELRAGEGHFVVGRRGDLIQLLVHVLLDVVGAREADSGPSSDALIPRGFSVGVRRAGGHEVVTFTDAGDEGTGARASLFEQVKRMGEHRIDLAVAQQIVIAHEGHIEIGARESGGVACSVVLPAAGNVADFSTRYTAIANAPAHLQRRLADGVRPVVLWIDGDDLFLEIMVQALPEFEVRVARSAAEGTQILTFGSDPAQIFCNVHLPDRPGHSLHAEIARRSAKLAARFVFVADGVLTPEIASYLIRSGCPTLMRPIDLDQVRTLALRDGTPLKHAVGARTLSDAASAPARRPTPDAQPGGRAIARSAVTQPAMPAVVAPPPAPTNGIAPAPAPTNGIAPAPAPTNGIAPPLHRAPAPSARATSASAAASTSAAASGPAGDGRPASLREHEISAIAEATAAALRRDGPRRGAHVLAMLRDRGLSDTDAFAVITLALSSGRIVRDPSPSTLLRTPDTHPRRTVLVVDDDYDLCETMRDVLEDEGYVVETASNGQEALDRLRQSDSLKIVVLDLMMPVMDGWHFLDEIKRDRALADIPVVVMSASKEGLRGLGAKEFLSKPLDYHKLLATVDRSLRSRPDLT